MHHAVISAIAGTVSLEIPRSSRFILAAGAISLTMPKVRSIGSARPQQLAKVLVCRATRLVGQESGLIMLNVDVVLDLLDAGHPANGRFGISFL